MNKRETGSKYENLAADLLQQKGFQILEKNFRCREGEIDLVAKEKEYLVFVEVKFRRNGKTGSAAAAVTYAKQKKICRSAEYYMMRKQLYGDTKARFDVVAIDGDRIRHIRNAFPYRGNMKF